MAEKTLAQIRQAVRFEGGYENLRRFPNTDVNDLIQKSFNEFWQLVDECNQGWWDTDGTVATTASVAYVALPTNAKSAHLVERLEGSEYVLLDKVSPRMRARYGSTTDTPRAYFLTARGIELLPPPNGVYTLRVHYTPKPAQLQESQPREWYDGWDDYVVQATLAKMDRREGRPTLNDRLVALDAVTKRVRSSASKRGEQEPEYLNLRERAAGVDSWGNGEID